MQPVTLWLQVLTSKSSTKSTSILQPNATLSCTTLISSLISGKTSKPSSLRRSTKLLSRKACKSISTITRSLRITTAQTMLKRFNRLDMKSALMPYIVYSSSERTPRRTSSGSMAHLTPARLQLSHTSKKYSVPKNSISRTGIVQKRNPVIKTVKYSWWHQRNLRWTMPSLRPITPLWRGCVRASEPTWATTSLWNTKSNSWVSNS